MRLSKGVLYAGLATAMLFAVSASAKAAGIPVTFDSGSGTATGTSTNPVGINLVTNTGSITTVNSTTGVTGLNLAFAEAISGSGGVITGISGTKVISENGSSVQIELRALTGTYNATTMTINAVMPAITGSNDVSGWDFTHLLGGTAVITVTGTNFDTLFADPAGTVVTGLSYTIMETVPEPSTMALLGIGMTGFFAFRRFFKRHATA